MLRLLVILLLLNGGPLGAQCDTVYLRVQRDSALRAHLGAAEQPAVTAYQQRALARLDSVLAQQCARPSIVDGVTTLALWPTGRQGVFPATGDSALVCAAVQRGPVLLLGRSTVTVRYLGSNTPLVSGDPVTRDSVTLISVCRTAWAASSERYRQGMAWKPIAQAPLIAVTWTVHALDLGGGGERVLLPIPGIP